MKLLRSSVLILVGCASSACTLGQQPDLPFEGGLGTPSAGSPDSAPAIDGGDLEQERELADPALGGDFSNTGGTSAEPPTSGACGIGLGGLGGAASNEESCDPQ